MGYQLTEYLAYKDYWRCLRLRLGEYIGGLVPNAFELKFGALNRATSRLLKFQRLCMAVWRTSV